MRILNNICFVASGMCLGMAYVDFLVGMKRVAIIGLTLGILALSVTFVNKEEK